MLGPPRVTIGSGVRIGAVDRTQIDRLMLGVNEAVHYLKRSLGTISVVSGAPAPALATMSRCDDALSVIRCALEAASNERIERDRVRASMDESLRQLAAAMRRAPTTPPHEVVKVDDVPPRKGGRAPKEFVSSLNVIAGAWLDANGIPEPRALLERYLLDVCDRQGWVYSETQAKQLARRAVDAYIAHGTGEVGN